MNKTGQALIDQHQTILPIATSMRYSIDVSPKTLSRGQKIEITPSNLVEAKE